MPQTRSVTSFYDWKCMTKKIVDIAVISVGMVFLCWYLPVAFYNVYACDDYWFGTNVRVNGFWGNQLFYYYNWEGSYTHTFLASLPHAFHSSCMPFLGNLFSLVLLFISVFCVFRTYTSLSVKRGIAYSLYFLSFLGFWCSCLSDKRINARKRLENKNGGRYYMWY